MSKRGSICPVTPDEDDPVKWVMAGLFAIFFVIPGVLILAAAILGGLFQLIFGNSFESL